MAQIVTQTIIIELSQLIKNSDKQSENLITDDLKSSLEAVTQELVGQGVVVEVSKLNQ
jgi:hypothetical protein